MFASSCLLVISPGRELPPTPGSALDWLEVACAWSRGCGRRGAAQGAFSEGALRVPRDGSPRHGLAQDSGNAAKPDSLLLPCPLRGPPVFCFPILSFPSKCHANVQEGPVSLTIWKTSSPPLLALFCPPSLALLP